MLSTRIQNILLAILCVIAVGLSFMAFRAVNAPTTSGLGTLPAGATPPSGLTDGADASTEGPDDEAATSEVPAGQVDVETWAAAWSGDQSHLLVIGDGYSHLPEQWVQRWSELLGQERAVSVRHWGEAEDRSFNEPIVLSETDGPELTVWSASRADTTIAEATERLGRFDEASADPDAVLVSLGQGSADEDVASALDDLVDGLPDAPVLVVVGPDGLYDEAVGEAFSAWAEDKDDRVALVDLRDALGPEPTADEWAQAFAAATSTG